MKFYITKGSHGDIRYADSVMRTLWARDERGKVSEQLRYHGKTKNQEREPEELCFEERSE